MRSFIRSFGAPRDPSASIPIPQCAQRRGLFISRSRLAFGLLAAALLPASGLAATTYTVTTDAEFASALSAAVNGDAIHVVSGSYTTSVVFSGRDIVIYGDGASSTTIDVGFSSACVDMSGTPAAAKFSGFTVRHGSGFEAGGINMTGSSATVEDCRIEDSVGFIAGGAYVNSSPTLKNCTFSGNDSSISGGGVWNDGGSVTLDHCDFLANTAASDGGGFYSSGSASLISCDFEANVSTSTNGGGIASSGPLSMVGCFFAGNIAVGTGGAVQQDGATFSAVNCTFSGNSAGAEGGGIKLANAGTSRIVNCTFSQNSTTTVGGAFWTGSSGPVTVSSSILWGDTGGEIHYDSGALTVRNSDVQGGFAGIDNIGASVLDDPRFVDADGADNTPGTLDDNLRLQDTSPCIDAGNNADINLTGFTTDQDGFARIVDGGVNGLTVDMGAYEFVPAPPPPPNPDQLIQDLKDSVTQLVSQGVHLPADGKTLQLTLNLARRWLANNRNDLAVAALSVFKLQVNAFRLAHRLTGTQAQDLIDQANVIISELSP